VASNRKNKSDSTSVIDVYATRFRDAVRILQVLRHAGERDLGSTAPSNAVLVLHAAMKLQALDFWMRYPDYLANEMIDLFEQTSNRQWLEQAATILDSEEPDLRRVDMTRLFYGAYEQPDDALATLVTYGLVNEEILFCADGSSVTERNYYVLKDGITKADEIAGQPPLDWFANRAKLVARVAGTRGGHALKDKQHQIADYHNALLGEIIKSIKPDVVNRLQTIRERKP
jgi:hypothetical protein